jgi:hypothetical protein
MPYNDLQLCKTSDQAFVAAVLKQRDKLMHPSSGLERANSLKDLRIIYDHKFGATALKRNLISLFLYAGPRLSLTGEQARLCGKQASVLYTGDGYLNTEARFDALERYIGRPRLSRLGCLQVMHHGSRKNWHPGLAAKFSPGFSVFSSDPSHKRFYHPNNEVVIDFGKFHPIQVNKEKGCHLSWSSYSRCGWSAPNSVLNLTKTSLRSAFAG